MNIDERADERTGPRDTAARDPSPDVSIEKQQLDRVFGEVLPDVTRDERDSAEERERGEGWYRENRPPHHDR